MFENRITHDNGQADANGKPPSKRRTGGVSRRVVHEAAPSPNGSNGDAGRSGDLPHAPAASHQPDGKFAPGNKGGPGNPFARQTARLRQVMLDATTPERMKNVADLLYDLTMQGNMAAAKLLLTFTIGKPKPAQEPDLLDEDEWNRYKAQAPMFGEMGGLVTTCSPELPLKLVRFAKPVVT